MRNQKGEKKRVLEEVKLSSKENSDDQDNGHSSCTENSTSDQEKCSERVQPSPLSPDDLVVQILARLDRQAYGKALYQDAKSINENFLAPRYFPWDSKARLPQKLIRTMPRDIDDLHPITSCQDELHSPFGDFQGPFGFGRYENGQSRGNYYDPDHVKMASIGFGSSAAARRSDDPGLIELNAQIPLPSSMEVLQSSDHTHDLTPLARWVDILSQDSSKGRMLSHLPFFWGKRDNCAPLRCYYDHLELLASDTPHTKRVIGNDDEWRKLTESKLITKTQIDFATSSTRKWKISTKVGGVSSRTSLFPSLTAVDAENSGQMQRKVRKMRPMLCLARLPPHTQTGRSVPMETASEMDITGFAYRLGSYDCRFVDNLLNPKKDSFGRAKRIDIGRTRIVWSNLIQGDSSQSTRNRVNYNSLITGRRLESTLFKRPLEVKVGVRLNGRIIMEEALVEDPTAIISNSRKRKHSTRQTESEGLVNISNAYCPESRTIEDIDAGIDNTLCWSESKRTNVRARKAVVYVEVEGESISRFDIERNDIISGLLRCNQKKSVNKKVKQFVSGDTMLFEVARSMDAGRNQSITKFDPPRMACVPLEDGLVRTLCLNAGNMPGTSVHQILRTWANEKSKRMCTICWSCEGVGNEGVRECAKCGLFAHSNCCFDKGDLVAGLSHTQDMARAVKHSNTITHFDAVLADDGDFQWNCSVCRNCTEVKPRRNARMPSRFIDSETYVSPRNGDAHSPSNANANNPGPECSLCPHRGGAMSPLETKNCSDQTQMRWVHEVCRVWARLKNANESDVQQRFPPNGSHVLNKCALCGQGGGLGKRSTACNLGLTRCAARGCLVFFHPMCALLASRSMEDIDNSIANAKPARTRMTRQNTGQGFGADEKESIKADKKLCGEFTLKLVQLASVHLVDEGETRPVVPIAFCGIHNPRRDDSVYGCLPGGDTV